MTENAMSLVVVLQIEITALNDLVGRRAAVSVDRGRLVSVTPSNDRPVPASSVRAAASTSTESDTSTTCASVVTNAVVSASGSRRSSKNGRVSAVESETLTSAAAVN